MRTPHRVLAAGLLATLVAGHAAAFEQPMSAFAANVGEKIAPDREAPSVTLYVVPDGRTLLVTDVLVANHGIEVGPVRLADSKGARCSIELLQMTLFQGNAGGFATLSNVHTRFSNGIPFAAGEPVIATLLGGSRGVDITITGKLIPGRRADRAIRLPGARRGESPADGTDDDAAGDAPER